MKTLNLDLTKKIQETMTKLRGNQEDKSWEIEEGLETEESWNQRQSELVEKLDSFMNEATKEDLVSITTKRVFDGQYSENSIYTY
jgi:hypothetical protein